VTLRRGGAVTTVVDVPKTFEAKRSPVLVLAHGAGTDLRSEFLEFFATELSERGLCVVRFNFPYKERVGKRPPDRMDVLIDTYVDVISSSGQRTGSPPGPLFLGGKSMGGRVAVNAVARGRVKPSGMVYLGYPLHPAGKQDKLRVEALKRVRKPHLFVQGSRDRLAELDLLKRVRKEFRIPGSLHVVEGGDHSFELPRRESHRQKAELERAADIVVRFVQHVLKR